MSLCSKLAGMQITWIFIMSHWLITSKCFSKPHLHGKKHLFSSSSWSRPVMTGSTHFFPYFQVLCPNSMLEARVQTGQLGARAYRGPSQGCNDGTQGVSFCDWAGRAGPILCHAWEQGEGWPGSGKATNIAQSSASVSVNLLLDISFCSNHVEEVWREMHKGKKEWYGNNVLCKKCKIRKLF